MRSDHKYLSKLPLVSCQDCSSSWEQIKVKVDTNQDLIGSSTATAPPTNKIQSNAAPRLPEQDTKFICISSALKQLVRVVWIAALGCNSRKTIFIYMRAASRQGSWTFWAWHIPCRLSSSPAIVKIRSSMEARWSLKYVVSRNVTSCAIWEIGRVASTKAVRYAMSSRTFAKSMLMEKEWARALISDPINTVRLS